VAEHDVPAEQNAGDDPRSHCDGGNDHIGRLNAGGQLGNVQHPHPVLPGQGFGGGPRPVAQGYVPKGALSAKPFTQQIASITAAPQSGAAL